MMARLNLTVYFHDCPYNHVSKHYAWGVTMNRRGRPPKPEGALAPAQWKAAQRERDRVALWVEGCSVAELTTTGLVEGLPSLIAGGQPEMLGDVLVELGRRGGVAVTARPAGRVRQG